MKNFNIIKENKLTFILSFIAFILAIIQSFFYSSDRFSLSFLIGISILVLLINKLEEFNRVNLKNLFLTFTFVTLSTIMLISNTNYILYAIVLFPIIILTILIFLGYSFSPFDFSYFIKRVSYFIFTMSFVLLINLFFMLFFHTLKTLFPFDINSYIHDLFIALCIAIPFLSSPIIFLTLYKKKPDIKLLLFPIKYIFAPILVGFYLLIYFYILRLIIISEYPKDTIPVLVSSILFFSYFYYLIDKDTLNSKLINFINKYSKYINIPLIILLFYSILSRIKQYGITENRYFILLFALVSSILNLLIFYKKQSLMATLVILALFISSIGPLSSINVAYYSQKKIFLRMIKDTDSFTKTENMKISRLIDFFHSREKIDSLGIEVDKEITREDFAKLIGANYTFDNYDSTLHWEEYSNNKTLNINDYDYFHYLVYEKIYLENLDLTIDYSDGDNIVFILDEKKYVVNKVELAKTTYEEIKEEKREKDNLNFVYQFENYEVLIYSSYLSITKDNITNSYISPNYLFIKKTDI